jgi:hypothetical protein
MEDPIEKQTPTPGPTSHERLLGGAKSKRKRVPFKGLDREFLLAQYQLEFTTREHVSIASRLMFILILLAEVAMDLSTPPRLAGVLGAAGLLFLLWTIDHRRRSARMLEFEHLLVSRLSKYDDESLSDDYITSRYYTPYRGFAVLFQMEPMLWASLVGVIAFAQKLPLFR